jgi:hypothetical protein
MQATQSLVEICAACWKRPGVLARELVWRWSFGIPTLAVLFVVGSRLAATVSLNQANLSLSDPLAAGQQITATAAALSPAVMRAARWLVPLLAIAWSVASGLGRNAVLHRLDPSLRPAPLTLTILQLLRIMALGAACVGWFYAVSWAAESSLGGAEPNMVAYSAWVICLTLGIFVLWALLSWIFFIAPVLAMYHGTGVLESLHRSLRLGKLSQKLIEINLVMGIVRLALIVLAMVFSAIPLPFETNMSGYALYAWWVFVALLYLVASDFFQVARLAAFLQFLRLSQTGLSAAGAE